MTNKRGWLVGATASLGVVTAAAGIYYWWLASVWGATDIQLYREADAIIGVGCVILVVAWALSRKRDAGK